MRATLKSDASNATDPGACRINMGAYGNTAQASRGVDRKSKGDVNDDCTINILDLLAIRVHLNQDPAIGGAHDADINLDGHVNVLDMLMARNNMGCLDSPLPLQHFDPQPL